MKFTKKDIFYLAIIALLIAAVVTVSVLWARSKPEEPTYYEKKCASFAVQNTNLSRGQIVFIGDSITDGYPLDAAFADLPLATYNRGIGGDVTKGVYDRLKVSLYDIAPSKVVLMIGINDINSGRTNDEIMINYKAIITDIKANLPTAEIICESVLPMGSAIENYGIDLNAKTAQIKDLNAQIKAYAEESGCAYVDLFAHFADVDDHMHTAYSDDALHPNATGYAVWTSVIRNYLV